MWEPTAKDYTNGGANKEDKQRVDSRVDSGFLSGSNLLSSEIDIDLEHEERQNEPTVIKIAPEPARAIDSGLDLGLSNTLSQLSLATGDTLNPLDSGTIHPNSEELEAEEVKKEDSHEPWEIYYIQDDDGDTQLHISIIQGFLEAAFFLISMAPHPCLLNILNDDCQAALHLAVLTQQPRIVRRLVLAGADLTIRNFRGNTPLHLACISGDIYCLKALTNQFTPPERTWLEPGKKLPLLPQNLEQRNYDGEMCLHIAAAKGHVELVRHLLRLGADVEAREGLGGRTALHLAVEHRRREVVHLLLNECRPQLDARTYAGLTAYHLARCLDQQLAMELTRCGATPSLPPELSSDSDSDSDEDDDEDNEVGESDAYRMTLARLGVGSKAMTALASA